MRRSTDNPPRQKKDQPYHGLFGLDKLPNRAKALNFGLTLIIGAIIAVLAWVPPSLDSGNPLYELSPPAWTLLCLLGWPIFAIILWLRLTGIKWSKSFLAVLLIMVFFVILNFCTPLHLLNYLLPY